MRLVWQDARLRRRHGARAPPRCAASRAARTPRARRTSSTLKAHLRNARHVRGTGIARSAPAGDGHRQARHLRACFMDTQDGRSHTQLGMERLIHIAK